MPSIFDAPIPSQRWALPEDDKWDIYYDMFEGWLDENYDLATGLVFGMSWEDACESEDLLDEYIDMFTEREGD